MTTTPTDLNFFPLITKGEKSTAALVTKHDGINVDFKKGIKRLKHTMLLYLSVVMVVTKNICRDAKWQLLAALWSLQNLV